MIAKINKIIDDTLKEESGCWSSKRLTMFVCTVMSILVGAYIVVSHLFTQTPPDPNSVTVFLGFLGGALGTSYLTVQDKKNQMQNKPEE